MAKILDNGDGMKKTIEITKDRMGYGAFHVAAMNGRTEICHYLIGELGFNPDFRSDEGLFLFFLFFFFSFSSFFQRSNLNILC